MSRLESRLGKTCLLVMEEAGTKVLASSCFWIVEQDAVVEWAPLR